MLIYPHCFFFHISPLVLAWTFTGSHGAHIHVVERLHGSPFEDITTIAPTLLYPFHGGYFLFHKPKKRRVEQTKSKKKEEGTEKARTKRLGDKVAFLWMQNVATTFMTTRNDL